jgi:trimeric autotransporter adhesin
MTGHGSRVGLVLVALTAALSVALAGTAQAAVTISRAEVSGDRLRIEGSATASRPITVDGVQMATTSSSGTFKIDRSGYTPPADCTVDVNDGSAAPVNVRLSGCTVTAPALSALSLTPATVQGGAAASATVTLTAPAPAGGAVVSLASSNTGAVTVPATLTVPAGGTSATTSSVATSAVTSTTTSVVSATYNGVTRTATMTVTAPAQPAPTATLDTVSLSPTSVQGGSTASATVTLTAPAPSGGAVVAFSSSNTAAVTVPATMTVPAGVNSRVVPTFVATSPVTSTTTSVVSATYNGVTRTATMTVTAPPPPQPGAALDAITLSPATVQTGTVRTSATLTFTAPTPTGGATVSLASSNTAIATVPATVTVPANSSTGAFEVTINASAAGTATISATYNGVTRSALLTVTTQSLLRIVTQSPLPNARVGAQYAGFIEACCGQGTGPIRWSLVSGTVPDGLRFAGNDLRLTQTTAVTGVATRVETTTFTVRARDGAGNTATKTFTLTVDPASPLVITNGTDQLSDGTVGVAYEVGLFPGGGVPPYSWSHVAGTLPPGLSVQASPGRVKGTPTTAGTFAFTVRVDDSSGQFATQQFSIRILP